MLIWQGDSFGDPREVLRHVSVEAPTRNGRDTALVRMRAASVATADVLMCKGLYQVKQPLPYVPGLELAGDVVDAPEGSGFQDGDRVLGLTRFPENDRGAFAEIVEVPLEYLFRLPDEVDYEAASVLSVAHGTALLGLHWQARVQEGETVLVLGAAGGVGSGAVELALDAGATVLAATTPDKFDFVRSLGAHHAVAADAETLREEVRDLVGEVDIVVDNIGGPLQEEAVRALAYRGRLLVVGFAGGVIGKVAANRLLLKAASAIGVNRDLLRRNDIAAFRRLHEELLELTAAKRIAPRVDVTFAFEDLPKAFDQLVSRSLRGRAVLLGPNRD
jgi:NADPH:quinone reductase